MIYTFFFYTEQSTPLMVINIYTHEQFFFCKTIKRNLKFLQAHHTIQIHILVTEIKILFSNWNYFETKSWPQPNGNQQNIWMNLLRSFYIYVCC